MGQVVLTIAVTAVLVFGLAAIRKYLTSRVQLVFVGLAFIVGAVYGSVSAVAFTLPLDLPSPFFEWENQF